MTKKINITHLFLFFYCFLFIPFSSSGCVSKKTDQKRTIVLFAAASTTVVVKELVRRYEDKFKIKVRTHFAASSMLARQIDAGAKADIFLSANQLWMNFLERRKLIRVKKRTVLMSNSLVLIVPRGSKLSMASLRGGIFRQSFKGKIAIADPEHVPLGIYAKEALIHLGWWSFLKKRLIATQNAPSNLHIMELGAVDIGISYMTDAIFSKKVKILYHFSQKSHKRIEYLIAPTTKATPSALMFLEFLKKQAKIFQKYGFIPSEG